MKYPISVSDRSNTPHIEDLYDLSGRPLEGVNGNIIRFEDVRETDRSICIFTGEDKNEFMVHFRFVILPEDW